MTDLLHFFSFQRDPFPDAVDPDSFYPSEQHELALVKLLSGIRQHRAVMLLWGVSGTGKTTLSRLLVRQLETDPCTTLTLPATPQMTMGALLDQLCRRLSGPAGRQARTREKLNWLEAHISAARPHRHLVCIVDEAHFLRSECLHLIRSLSNWEADGGKLVTILFVAEPAFLRRLEHPSHAAIRSRISLNIQLPLLPPADTEQLIKYRLLVAGGESRVFAADCFSLIHEASAGNPRLINKIAANALLESYCRGRNRVTSDQVRRAIAEC
ncbi:MAG: AAA family ATPase [Deltaproteobacteria bacterium]|nr:AAA family ATPase [Candidatus Anaeroferrophillacea bacterium]